MANRLAQRIVVEMCIRDRVYTLFCTFIILPALLGPVPVKRDDRD